MSASNSLEDHPATATVMEPSERTASDVIVVGAGFSGVYALYRFRKLGLSTLCIDAGSDFGGTWFWNRYPGARVDSETPFYSFSMPEVYDEWTWSERFPGHKEIRRYFNHVAKVLDLRKDTMFDTIVQSAVYEEGRWNLTLSNGKQATCTYLILGTGSSYKKHYPSFPGLHKFKGTLLHSAFYPEEEIDVTAKRVAVIGSGASGVQTVQELSKQSCSLTNFIRTPSLCFPMRQRPLNSVEQDNLKCFYSEIFKAAHRTAGGVPYNTKAESIWNVTAEEREAHFEQLWNRGGFSFIASNYTDFMHDAAANKLMYDFWVKKTRARMTNSAKADIVAPLEQTVLFGTKRPSLEMDYFESLDCDNVTLVDLQKTPIVTFTEKGIQLSDGVEHEFDIVILATGFDSMTGSVLDIDIRGLSGTKLRDQWKKATYTHLGLMINDMPNLFLSYSPQAPTAFANGPGMIQMQIDWVANAIAKMQEEKVKAIHPTFEATDKWRADIQEVNSKTLFPTAKTW